jgi:hypothetical protein
LSGLVLKVNLASQEVEHRQMEERAAREVNLCPKACNREERLQMKAAELQNLCVCYAWNIALRV